MKAKVVGALLVTILLLNGCATNSYIVRPSHDSVETMYVTSTSLVMELGDKPLVDHHINDVTLTAVGDIMFHKWQLTRAYDHETDSFDFTGSFAYVKNYLENSDFTIGNLETTLAGRDKGRNFRPDNAYKGYHGYPVFNTPEILAYNLKEVGFDLVSTSNNHSLDSKTEGLKATLDRLDEQGISHVGTYRNEEEANEIFMTTIKDIQFAFLAYTYGTNGFVVPEEESYIINTLDRHTYGYYDEKINEIVEAVKKADETNADFVITMIHFGNEYFDFPNSHQRDIVDKLFEAGADVIIGSHPHVLQPLEIREIENEDGTTRKGVVIYSLGNFISSQRYSRENPSNTDIGAIMDINFRKIDNHKPEIVSVSFVPTCTFRNKKELAVLPVDEVVSNMESYNLDINDYGISRLMYTHNNTIKHLLAYTSNEYTYQDYKYTIAID